jgi:hypothetical protein
VQPPSDSTEPRRRRAVRRFMRCDETRGRVETG